MMDGPTWEEETNYFTFLGVHWIINLIMVRRGIFSFCHFFEWADNHFPQGRFSPIKFIIGDYHKRSTELIKINFFLLCTISEKRVNNNSKSFPHHQNDSWSKISMLARQLNIPAKGDKRAWKENKDFVCPLSLLSAVFCSFWFHSF